jgi:hypothetical protein
LEDLSELFLENSSEDNSEDSFESNIGRKQRIYSEECSKFFRRVLEILFGRES